MARFRLMRELRRRHVYRVVATYIVVGWLLIQIATQVFPYFQIPDWSVRLLVLLVLAGFPVALVLAWAFDATPHGIKRTDDDGQPVLRHARRGTLVVASIGALLAIMAGAAYWMWHRAPAIASTTEIVASATSVHPEADVSIAIPGKSIAVLPFENLSADKNNAYFADGMRDLILTKLADIGDLKVISRTSTEQYGSHPGNLKAIARQLGVATILEGSVQKAGNDVLINLQLINANTDAHIWAESYTRTLDNIFGVEGEVAQKVADALEAELTPTESAAIAKVPTRNKTAYQAFLKAVYYLNDSNRTGDASELEQSIALAKEAVSADPSFADAWTLLALAYQKIGNHNADVEKASLRALAIDANNADARTNYAFALMNRRDFKAAIAQAQKGVRMEPRGSDNNAGLGFVYLAAGDLGKANAAFSRAVQINPRFNFARKWVAIIAMKRRDYAAARDKFQYVVANDPADVVAATTLAEVYEFGWGDLDAAREVLHGAHPPVSSSGALSDAWYWLHMYARDYPAALAVIQRATASWFEQTGHPLVLYQARVYRAQGDAKRATHAFAQAQAQIESRIKTLPKVASLHASLSLALAALGHDDGADGEAQRAAKLADVFSGDQHQLNFAAVEAWTGKTGAAIERLDELLGKPSGDVISVSMLKLDPTWDPIRHDPRFQALLAKYGNAGSAPTRH